MERGEEIRGVYVAGLTIQIYLPDGNPNGLKICDERNLPAKSFIIPRAMLQEAGKLEDIKAPGVYFLFGEEDEGSKQELYIGKSENVYSRLKQHDGDKEKDFWITAVCFVSEKKNLNTAHIQVLENYFCEKASAAKNIHLQNSATPTKSFLSDSDREFVLSFYENAKLLLSALRYPIFDEVKKDEKKLLFCKGKEASATGIYSETGLTVFKGSTAIIKDAPSANESIVALRNRLKESGILKQDGNAFVFTEDYRFKSPSSASDSILGRSTNGWMEWKDKDGKTLDEKYRKSK